MNQGATGTISLKMSCVCAIVLLCMISTFKGVEDHATLLCSLLLGFGLDAYVCVGTKSKGIAHTWVMTLGHNGVVTFWEPLTAQR